MANKIQYITCHHLMSFVFNVCYRVLLTDADLEVPRATRYYGTKYGLNGANLAINYGLTRFPSQASSLIDIVKNWIDGSPMKATANWLVLLILPLL